MITRSIIVVFIFTIFVNVSFSNYSFGIDYYGAHNSGSHRGNHSSFGRHGVYHSSNLHNNHSNRLHSSLYNRYGNRSYRSDSNHGYCPQSNYVQNNNYYIVNKNADSSYEYVYKEPYVFDYGNEYSADTDAYVFQYGKNNSNLLAYNDAN